MIYCGKRFDEIVSRIFIRIFRRKKGKKIKEMRKLDILRYLAIEYWFIGLICSRKSDWCNFWELARIPRSGTHIEAMHVSRERLSLSQQVSGFIPMTCIWYVCLLYASALWKLWFILSYCMESRDCMARYYWHIDICAWDWDVALIV